VPDGRTDPAIFRDVKEELKVMNIHRERIEELEARIEDKSIEIH
jgi:hypothetical protein